MVINSSAQKIYRMYVTVKKHLTFPWLPQCISETELSVLLLYNIKPTKETKILDDQAWIRDISQPSRLENCMLVPFFFKQRVKLSLQYGPRPAWHDINIYQFMTLQISSNYFSWKYCKHNPLLKDVFIKLKRRIKIRSLKRIGYIQVI